jgi:hypothetical protein
MPKTATQVGLDADQGKELLKQHQPGEGGEGLVLEPQLRDTVGFTSDVRSAMPHWMDLFGLLRFFDSRASYPKEVHLWLSSRKVGEVSR